MENKAETEQWQKKEKDGNIVVVVVVMLMMIVMMMKIMTNKISREEMVIR